MEVAAVAAQPLQQFIQAMHALHDDMLHAIDAFQAAVDLHQLGIDQYPVLAIGQVPPDHGIDHAGLVFKGEEGNATGGLRALAHALRSEDPFRRFAVAGLAILFGLQSAINMAVNIHLVPAKGMTLPFISYGGSSMISVAWAMGMLLALSRDRPRTVQLARHGNFAPAASPA